MKHDKTVKFLVFSLAWLGCSALAKEASTNLGRLPSSLSSAPTAKGPGLMLPGEEELNLDDPSMLLEMEEQVTAAPEYIAEPPRVLTSEALGNVLPPMPEQVKPPPPRIPLLAAMDPAPAPLIAKAPASITETKTQAAPAPATPAQPASGGASPALLSVGPMLGGVGFPAIPPPPEPPEPPQKTKLPDSTAMPALKGVPDVSIILSNNQFYPSKIRLKDGMQTRLIFTTVNKKPAALVIERLQIQRWIAKENETKPASELDRARWEVNKELVSTKVTEIILDPKKGSYGFHDAISGAIGEIEVE